MDTKGPANTHIIFFLTVIKANDHSNLKRLFLFLENVMSELRVALLSPNFRCSYVTLLPNSSLLTLTACYAVESIQLLKLTSHSLITEKSHQTSHFRLTTIKHGYQYSKNCKSKLEMSNTQLPDLQSAAPQPIRHQASCASLSFALLQLLNDVLPSPPSLTLSVGSGTGLIEALLLHHFPSRAPHISLPQSPVDNHSEDNDGNDNKKEKVHNHIQGSFYGVEVRNAKSVNRFLPQENMITVPGTWALPGEHILSRAEGLLFIYPRQTGLIWLYLEKCANLQTVVWIGPRCDEDEFMKPLGDWGVRVGDEEFRTDGDGDGEKRLKFVEDGEVVVVYRKRVE